MEYIPIFYTNREQDALFVENKTSGLAGSINASSYGLVSSFGTNSVSWDKRNLVSGTEAVLGWRGGLGFYGSTPISKPSGSNLVNSITSLGLANYTATTGNNFASLIFNSTGITYLPTTASQNIAQQIVSCGVITPFIQPIGSNLVNLITQSGLAQYSAPSGTNFINCLTSSGVISYNIISTQNIVSALNETNITSYGILNQSNLADATNQSGLVAYTTPTGSSFINLITQAGLLQYTTPTGSNLYTSLSSTNLFSITQVTGNNVFSAGASIVGGEKPQYASAYAAAVRMGFLNDPNNLSWWQTVTMFAPSITAGNAISILLNYPNIVPTQNANTLGIFPWSDATYMTTVSLYFGNVPCSGGSVTRQVSFGGTISSSIVTWWNMASFGASIGGGPGVVCPSLFVASNQITLGNQIGGFAFLGLPMRREVLEPTEGYISPNLIFRVASVTNTGAVIECINPYRETINQGTATFRIVAF